MDVLLGAKSVTIRNVIMNFIRVEKMGQRSSSARILRHNRKGVICRVRVKKDFPNAIFLVNSIISQFVLLKRPTTAKKQYIRNKLSYSYVYL